MSKIEPDKKVPKKYRKYANEIVSKQFYKVRPMEMGVIHTCCDCREPIPAGEEFMALFFREAGTDWTGKVYLALCMNCAKKAKLPKAKE